MGTAQAAQVEDGVPHQLAGAVVGDVSAAIDLVEGDAARGEQRIGGQHVAAVRVAAEGEHGGMLEQEQDVLDAVLKTQRSDFRLDAQGFVVGDSAKVEVVDHLPLDCSQRAGMLIGQPLFLEVGCEEPCKYDAVLPGNQQPKQESKRTHPNAFGVHQEVKDQDVEEHGAEKR